MDPNAALAELRRLVTENDRDSHISNRSRDAIDRRLDRMCELVEALDGWIVGGGFLPSEWSQPR